MPKGRVGRAPSKSMETNFFDAASWAKADVASNDVTKTDNILYKLTPFFNSKIASRFILSH